MDALVKILTACVPILVALVGIIPTIISNRKKTEQSIKESQDTAKKDMVKMQSTLDAHIREDEDEKARNQRYRILRFYDEMCDHRHHSESHFEDILDDIDAYERYCETHPQFKNNRGKAAMDYIVASYPKIKSSGGFLSHDPDHNRTAGE